MVLVAICCSSVSLYLGATMARPSSGALAADGRLAPAGNVESHWTYNYTFAQEPNVRSEEAWASLPPVGGAFIRNPDSGLGEMNVAMYHQLHCLHGLRIAYYLELAKNNATLNEIMSDVRSQWGDHDPAHTIHCFDYLRQAIQCAADSNLEPFNATTGHVDAWHTARKCRNRAQLDDWAYQWRSSNRTGITKINSVEEMNQKGELET